MIKKRPDAITTTRGPLNLNMYKIRDDIMAFLSTSEALDWHDAEIARHFRVCTNNILNHWQHLFAQRDQAQRRNYQRRYGVLAEMTLCSIEHEAEEVVPMDLILSIANLQLVALMPIACQCWRMRASRRDNIVKVDRPIRIHRFTAPKRRGVAS